MTLPGSLEFNLLVGDTLAVERADDGERFKLITRKVPGRKSIFKDFRKKALSFIHV